MGKSLGDGIYNTRDWQGKLWSPEEMLEKLKSPFEWPQKIAYGEVLKEIYDFMWKHIMNCHQDEFKIDELFKIVGEVETCKVCGEIVTIGGGDKKEDIHDKCSKLNAPAK